MCYLRKIIVSLDVKDENQCIRRSEMLGGERLMWLTRDMSDPNNEKKFTLSSIETLI